MVGMVTRRTAVRLGLGGGLALLASACGPTTTASPARPPNVPGQARSGQPFDPVLANSELVVGRNRLAVGLIGEGNRPITDARVQFGLLQVSGQQATRVADVDAQFRWIDLEPKGMYVAAVHFDAPGRWGIEVTASRPGRPAEVARLPIDVQAEGRAPTIGSPAPRAPAGSPAAADAAEPCSNVPPCELHAPTLDQALATGRPTVVVFATPGYCVTATCAPVLGVVLEARARQPARASFVHVEIYADPRNRVIADAVARWNLPREPWTFLVDANGTIVDLLEGIVTAEELDAALAALG